MPQHRHRSTGVRRAIKREIHRLGIHARPEDVVAALARLGMEVCVGQVERVKIKILRDQCRTTQAANDSRKAHQLRTRRGLQKVPERRWRK